MSRVDLSDLLGERRTCLGKFFKHSGSGYQSKRPAQPAATSDGSIKEPWFALGVGAIVGGIASYALGKYVFGGQDCAPAKEIFDRRSGQFSSSDEKDVEGSDVDEIESVAKDFNARFCATATSN